MLLVCSQSQAVCMQIRKLFFLNIRRVKGILKKTYINKSGFRTGAGVFFWSRSRHFDPAPAPHYIFVK